MPDHYKMVFNGTQIVRRKIATKRGKQVIVPDSAKPQQGTGVVPVVDKKEQQAKLRAELFKTF